MLSDTADSPLHCLKSTLKCLSFLPLVLFLQVKVKLKVSRSLFSFLSFSQRASCFSHSFVTSAPLCQYFFLFCFIHYLQPWSQGKKKSGFRESNSCIIDNIYSVQFNWVYSSYFDFFLHSSISG